MKNMIYQYFDNVILENLLIALSQLPVGVKILAQ